MLSSLRRFLVLFSGGSLIMMGTTGCQKQAAAPEKPAALTGSYWELRQVAGGITGRIQPIDPTRQAGLLFGTDGQVRFLLNGAVTGTSSYALSQSVAYLTQRPETFITYGMAAPRPTQYIATLSATTLVLTDDYPDGFSATYQRVPLSCWGPPIGGFPSAGQ